MRSHRHAGRLLSAVALLTSLGVTDIQAQESPQCQTYDRYTYQYVSVSGVATPPNYGCFSSAGQISERRIVYGTLQSPIPQYCDEEEPGIVRYVSVYKDGVITPLTRGDAWTSNEPGMVGGRVFDETRNAWRAALFHGSRVEILPLLSENELESHVSALSNSGLALVVSTNRYGFPYQPTDWTVALYKNGRWTPLNFGSRLVLPWSLRMNNQGLLAGNILGALPPDPKTPDRAFVLNPRTGKLTTFPPASSGDVFTFSNDINDRGQVLGYSFKAYAQPATIGIWGQHRLFRTYFDEADARPDFVSNRLRFNNQNLIVVSGLKDDVMYLIPRPGVLLDLTERVIDLPAGLSRRYVYVADINDRGDMLGAGALFDSAGQYIRSETFVLKRVGPGL